MLKKILLATLASLFTTLGMMLIYKSIQSPKKIKFQQLETQEQIDTSLPEFQKALNSIKTIVPKDLKQLPAEIIFLLERENCKIPLIPNSKNPYGWIRGHFIDKSQTDYAALCLTPQNEMTIKVAWGGKRACSVSLGYGMVQKFITAANEKDFSYSRILLTSPAKRLNYFAYHNNQQLPAEGQDGIEDTLIGKGAVIHYCVDGQWIPLQTTLVH